RATNWAGFPQATTTLHADSNQLIGSPAWGVALGGALSYRRPATVFAEIRSFRGGTTRSEGSHLARPALVRIGSHEPRRIGPDAPQRQGLRLVRPERRGRAVGVRPGAGGAAGRLRGPGAGGAGGPAPEVQRRHLRGPRPGADRPQGAAPQGD